MATFIVQLGYAIFGCDDFEDIAIENASENIADPETYRQGTTPEVVRKMLVPLHNACDGDLTMIEIFDDLPDNWEIMNQDDLYSCTEERR